MNIIQIGSFPLDSSFIKGGVEASVYGLAIEQAKQHFVLVLDLPRFEIIHDFEARVSGCKVFRFSNKLNSNFNSIFRLMTFFKIIKKNNPNICHIHTTSLFSLILFLLLKLNRIPVVVTVHGLAHIEKKNILHTKRNIRNFLKFITQSLSEFLFLSICPVFIADTQYVVDTIKMYKKEYKIFRLPKCIIIPQGINDVFFTLDNNPIKEVLLSVGAINKRKGHLFLIESMVQVKMKYPNFILSIVGILSDNNYYEVLKARILELGLEQNIHIYPNLAFNDILELYKNAKLFVLHTEEESQGIVFCEAMATGKPIVTTNVGGVPWVVENNVNGSLSNYGDIDTFANNVIKLLEFDTLCKIMADNNIKQSHKYEWKYISTEIIEVYKSII